MGSKCRRKKQKKRKNRGGERLQEWRILKSYNCLPSNVSTSNEGTDRATTSGQSNDDLCSLEPDSHIPLQELLIEGVIEDECHKHQVVQGRRIVDIAYLFEKLKLLNNHAPQFGCSFSNLVLTSEITRGLRSGFIFVCNMCGFKETVWSDPNNESSLDINAAAVAGSMSTGGGFANLTKLFGAMNVRCMGSNTYDKYKHIVSKGWEDSALAEMKVAAEEEAALARERNDVDKDGVPLLTVVADGSWSKRSYRTNFNSLSGVVAIVGYHTRKVLYFGVKNKYCVVCARASNKASHQLENVALPKHTCFKNWTGSSSSMEAMAIAEGFLMSEEMHGVKYSKFIADGDSSVYTKILEYRPYDTLTVEKIECRNHLFRNFNNKLKEIATSSYKGDDTNKELYLKMRRTLGNRLLRCRVGVKKAIEHRKNEAGSLKTKADKLRKDIINTPSHVFGEHKKCEEIGYFCNGIPKEREVNLVEDMKSCGIYQQIMIAVNALADYSYHLIQDVDSNSVEQYNSVIAMYTGGKRINQIQRNGYQTRCAAAVVKYNSRQPFYKLHKSITKSSPGVYAKLYEIRAKRKAEKDLERSKKKPKARRSLLLTAAGPDKDYGPLAQKPDIDEALYETKVKEHLENLRKTENDIEELERLTLNQKDSTLWLEQRRLRLTASSFGLVCNRKEDSSCGPVVQKLLYSKVDCAATRYGQAHEADAVTSFERLTGCKVSKCGLFIDRQRPWLAASPDGLVSEDSLIEVKCPLTGKNITPDEVVEKKKGVVGSFWQYDKTNNSYSVNKRHTYYYQIQGQLHITQRQFGFMVLWTPLGVRVEKISRDDSFWETNMLSKLERFYYNCLLPEIIDPRRRRNMPIREPLYILEAKREKISKKEKKLKMSQR